MANHFRLFGRPLMADEVLPELSVTGTLEGYTSGAAYESRLQINNPVGRCTVEILASNLPSGASVRIDNLTKEVVVKWDAYEEVVATESKVPNGSFEDGDNGTWVKGPGWSIGTGSDYPTKDGVYSARFANLKTQGSDLVLPMVAAKVNDYIKVRAQIQQGASSEGNAGARVWLTFHDSTGKQIGDHPGTWVKSGKAGSWKESSAEGGAPAGTAGVMVRVAAYRSKENYPLWVDDITWNHKYSLGTTGTGDYSLSIQVVDSLNRVAYWAGTIQKAPDAQNLGFDPVTASSSALLTNNNRTLSSSSGEGVSLARTKTGVVNGSSDKRMVEFVLNSADLSVLFGYVSSNLALPNGRLAIETGNYSGAYRAASQQVWQNGTYLGTNGHEPQIGDVIGLCFNCEEKRMYFYSNGVLVDYLDTPDTGGPKLHFAMNANNVAGQQVTIRTTVEEFSHPISGYTGLDNT